jgi:hypothetical protein
MKIRSAQAAVLAALTLALGYACSDTSNPSGLSHTLSPATPRYSTYNPSTFTLGVNVGSSQGNHWTGTVNRWIKTTVTGAQGSHNVQWWQSWCANDGSDYCSENQIIGEGQGLDSIYVELPPTFATTRFIAQVWDSQAHPFTGTAPFSMIGPPPMPPTQTFPCELGIDTTNIQNYPIPHIYFHPGTGVVDSTIHYGTNCNSQLLRFPFDTNP